MTGVAADPGREADAVVASVLACPGVSGLDERGSRPLATYLPGRRVAGVRIEPGRIQVGVSVAPGSRVPDVAAAIRASLAGLAAGRPVDVHVTDVGEPPAAIRAG